MIVSQLMVLLVGLLALVTSLWAIVEVLRSDLRWKPLWIIGSLFGFIGLGIDWASPDDMVLLVGLTIPPVMISTVAGTGHIIIKTGFPIIAAVALMKASATPS